MYTCYTKKMLNHIRKKCEFLSSKKNLFSKKTLFFPFLYSLLKHIRNGNSPEWSFKHVEQSLAVALQPQKHSIIQELPVGVVACKLQFAQIFDPEYLSL